MKAALVDNRRFRVHDMGDFGFASLLISFDERSKAISFEFEKNENTLEVSLSQEESLVFMNEFSGWLEKRGRNHQYRKMKFISDANELFEISESNAGEPYRETIGFNFNSADYTEFRGVQNEIDMFQPLGRIIDSFKAKVLV